MDKNQTPEVGNFVRIVNRDGWVNDVGQVESFAGKEIIVKVMFPKTAQTFRIYLTSEQIEIISEDAYKKFMKNQKLNIRT